MKNKIKKMEKENKQPEIKKEINPYFIYLKQLISKNNFQIKDEYKMVIEESVKFNAFKGTGFIDLFQSLLDYDILEKKKIKYIQTDLNDYINNEMEEIEQKKKDFKENWLPNNYKY